MFYLQGFLNHRMKNFFFCILLLFCSKALLAESKNIYGIDFSVDQIRSIDKTSSKVSVLGNLRIISPKNEDRYIVETHLKNGNLLSTISKDKVFNFIALALENKNTPLAALMTVYHLALSRAAAEDKMDFLYQFYSHNKSTEGQAIDLYKELIASYPDKLSDQILAYLILRVGTFDPRLAKASAPENSDGFFLTTRKVLIQILDQENQGQAVGEGAGEVSARYLGKLGSFISRDLFPTSRDAKRLSLSVKKIASLLALPVSLDIGKLYPFMSVKARSEDDALITPFLSKKVAKFANFAVKEKAPIAALSLFADLDDSQISESTQRGIIDALRLLETPNEKLESSTSIKAMLVKQSSNSQAVKDEYGRYLKENFYHALGKNRLHSASRIRDELSEITQDDLSLYDQMLFDEALQWIARDRTDEADERLALRKSSLSLSNYLTLFLKGKYGSPLHLSLIALIPLLILYFIRLQFTNKKTKPSVRKFEDSMKQEYLDEEEALQNFDAFVQIRGGVTSEVAEYRELLTLLELDDSAELSTIKKAYRKKIKELHPDVKPNAGKDTVENFVKLSEGYERILELNKLFAQQ